VDELVGDVQMQGRGERGSGSGDGVERWMVDERMSGFCLNDGSSVLARLGSCCWWLSQDLK
jgi:hypothetical protein